MRESGREEGEKWKRGIGNRIRRNPFPRFPVPLFPVLFKRELLRHTSIGFAKSAPGETARYPDDDGRDRWRGRHRYDGFIWPGLAAQHALAF